MSDIPAFMIPAGGCLHNGMTLRDYFAAAADVSLYTPVENLRNKLGRDPSVSELAEYIAVVRRIEADAMLAERERGMKE